MSKIKRSDESEKITENLEQRGKRDYEQDLERVSGRGKKKAGEDRQEHIRKSERDEDIQNATAVQINNTEEVKR